MSKALSLKFFARRHNTQKIKLEKTTPFVNHRVERRPSPFICLGYLGSLPEGSGLVLRCKDQAERKLRSCTKNGFLHGRGTYLPGSITSPAVAIKRITVPVKSRFKPAMSERHWFL